MTEELRDLAETGPFTFRWPDAEESFERGWTGSVVRAGSAHRFRYGIGERMVYGSRRGHSVVWIDGDPIAEGVAADDHEHSRCLVSRIKGSDRKVVRHREDLPPGLETFTVVEHREEINAPHSPTCLAVKIPEDDVRLWVNFALWRRDLRKEGARRDPKPTTRVVPGPAPLPAKPRLSAIADDARKAAVARALIAFEERTNGPLQQGSVRFSSDDAAERFVREDDFAFLLAVIFDQGVPFERAWRAPLLLRERLGHLDPVRIAAEPESVQRAIATSPTLHRYINKLPLWVCAAAARVTQDYDGNANRIWRDASAAEVVERLDAFIGISQKKAAMAVILLWRNRNTPLRDMHTCDVAVDVHLRRVFLRTGLVERDVARDMIEAARELYPRLPGALDPPAWAVGREWCHPQIPDCPSCALTNVCPKLISRGLGVSGP